jgi:phosphatidylglycerol:prolipoprotein diacylglycerol transferase
MPELQAQSTLESGGVKMAVQNWLHKQTSIPIVLWRAGSFILVRFGVVSALSLLLGLAAFIVLFRSIGVGHEAMQTLLLLSPASLILFSFLQGILFVEGGIRTSLRRIENITFGFFGGICGILIAFVLSASYYNLNLLLMLDASALLWGFIHGFARTACINYGCCHGKEIPLQSPSGKLHLIYTDPLSKAVRISNLGHRPLYAVQLYESIGCLLIGAFIVLLAHSFHRTGRLLGAYLLLYGALRFVCEFYRGEKDTLYLGKLSVYQWISIGLCLAGIAFLAYAATSAPARIAPSIAHTALLSGYAPHLIAMPAVMLFFYGFHYKTVGKWC